MDYDRTLYSDLSEGKIEISFDKLTEDDITHVEELVGLFVAHWRRVIAAAQQSDKDAKAPAPAE